MDNNVAARTAILGMLIYQGYPTVEGDPAISDASQNLCITLTDAVTIGKPNYEMVFGYLCPYRIHCESLLPGTRGTNEDALDTDASPRRFQVGPQETLLFRVSSHSQSNMREIAQIRELGSAASIIGSNHA